MDLSDGHDLAVGGKIAPDDRRPGLEAAMRSELHHILKDRSFAKSPTLSKLLAYLVYETLNGNGDKLKSYTVAVDCLGKSPDFDAKSDSYPRVQTMRLRKLLEAFYARHMPQDGLCLYLVAGSYRVRIGSPESAYPDLYRQTEPKSGARTFPDPNASAELLVEPYPQTVQQDPVSEDKSGLKVASTLAFAFAIAMFVAAVYFWVSGTENEPVRDTSKPMSVPVILMEKIDSPRDDNSVEMANDLFAKFVDGMGRSWAVRVRLGEGKSDNIEQADINYRLEARLGENYQGRRPLYLRLTAGNSSDLIWSTTTYIDPGKSPQQNLGPSISELSSPYGIISKREAGKITPESDSGYACLLRYMTYVRTQNIKLRPDLAKCLAKPIGDSRLDAVRLAVRSFFVLETSNVQNRQLRLAAAKAFAAQSIASDPEEAYAHFAEARLKYLLGDCAAGNAHTLHALQANPYDPAILAVLGNFSTECGLPEGEEIAQRAFELRTPGETFSRLSLILASIRDNDRERLISLSSSTNEGTAFSPAYFHLCETLIAAGIDRPDVAKTHWKKFAEISGNGKSANEMLAQVVISQRIRDRILGFLRQKAVLNEELHGVTGVN